MGISKEEAIKELQTREEIFVAYSQATKLPYVKCDEETFNDQAWIFSTEEGIKEHLFQRPWFRLCPETFQGYARQLLF